MHCMLSRSKQCVPEHRQACRGIRSGRGFLSLQLQEVEDTSAASTRAPDPAADSPRALAGVIPAQRLLLALPVTGHRRHCWHFPGLVQESLLS